MACIYKLPNLTHLCSKQYREKTLVKQGKVVDFLLVHLYSLQNYLPAHGNMLQTEDCKNTGFKRS